MATETATDAPATPSNERFHFRQSVGSWLAFWCTLIAQTLGGRSVNAMLRSWRRHQKVQVSGLAHVPDSGSFVLALNHFSGGWSPFVIASVLEALSRTRPDAAAGMSIVIGRKADDPKKKRPAIVRAMRRLFRWGLERWSANTLTIALGNSQLAIGALKEWRKRAAVAPSLVFPEGLASLDFRKIRPGAGLWLRALNVPCIPVAVWWQEGSWQVCFGAPIRWSKRQELSDVQVGLSIAQLLPQDLAPEWTALLTRWKGRTERPPCTAADPCVSFENSVTRPTGALLARSVT